MLKLKYVDTQLITWLYIAINYCQVNNDYDFFKENMEIHVKISIDGAEYTRGSSFCLLSVSVFTRDYSLSPKSK